MAKFVKFANARIFASGPADQPVFINPEHVRVIRVDYPHSGTIIELEGQEISVLESVDNVIKALS
jgi:hypothetical protein